MAQKTFVNMIEEIEFDDNPVAISLALNPANFFTSEEDLNKFLQENFEALSIEDFKFALNKLLKECEKEELYEYCYIIYNKIKEYD